MTKIIVEVVVLNEEDVLTNSMMLIFESVLHLNFEVLSNKFFSVVGNTAQNAVVLPDSLVLLLSMTNL